MMMMLMMMMMVIDDDDDDDDGDDDDDDGGDGGSHLISESVFFFAVSLDSAVTLLNEECIQRVSERNFRGHFGDVRDYLGVMLGVFWEDFKRNTT